MQTKSPSQKGTAKTTTKCTQVEYHHHYQGSNKEAATHCQTGLIQQQHQSQAPPFAFRHNDPKVQHTVRCCSTESLDPCDNVERWLELVKHGTLPVTPANADGAASPLGGKAITLEMDLMQQQQQQQMEDCNPQEGMLVTAAATTTAIEALPLPLLAGTASSTTIDACMFPSVFGSVADTADGGGGLSCQSPRYMLTPLAPATVAYFRRLGVPSRIYGCSSALDPSQPGQLTFQRVDTTPNTGGGQQQQQQQRAAFAIINVNHFNFVSRLN